MQIPDSLLTIAELALGLAGFSGVILVFGGTPEAMHPVDLARMRLLLSMSLGAMVLSLLPFGIQLLGATGPTLWRLGCGSVVGYFVLIGALFILDVRRMGSSPRADLLGGGPGGRLWASVVAVVGVAAFLAPALHAVGLFPTRGPAIFFFVMLWLLTMAGYLFASLVFVRPQAR